MSTTDHQTTAGANTDYASAAIRRVTADNGMSFPNSTANVTTIHVSLFTMQLLCEGFAP